MNNKNKILNIISMNVKTLFKIYKIFKNNNKIKTFK